MNPILSKLVLTALLTSSPAFAASLTLGEIAKKGYVSGLACTTQWNRCEGKTPLAPNALAAALGLPSPNLTKEMWDTAGGGWRAEIQKESDWVVFFTPLGRKLSLQELRQHPEYPAPNHSTLPSISFQGRKLSDMELSCTAIVDVRNLGAFKKEQANILYDSKKNKIWSVKMEVMKRAYGGVNDGDRVRFITSGQLDEYRTSESNYLGVLRIKAMRLDSTGNLTKIFLGPNSTRDFQNYSDTCRIVYLMDGTHQSSESAPAQPRESGSGVTNTVPLRR